MSVIGKPLLIFLAAIWVAVGALYFLQTPSLDTTSPEQYLCGAPGVWLLNNLNKSYDERAFATRKAEQMASFNKERVFAQFHFADAIDVSGITFVYESTDDTTKNLKPNHYDHAGSVAAADVDGDGFYDLYFVNQMGRSELWINEGNGKFHLSPFNDPLALANKAAFSAAFADINNDGRPDLIVTTIRHGLYLFENVGGGKFKNVSNRLPKLPLAHSSSATFFDFDNDGLLDIFVANVGKFTSDLQNNRSKFEPVSNAPFAFTRKGNNEESFLLKNLGDGHFEEVSARLNLPSDAGWFGHVIIGDFDKNGFPDIYALSMNGPDHLLLNQKGVRFLEATDKFFRATPFGSMGGALFDSGNEGNLGLFVTDMHSDMHSNRLSFAPASDVILEKSKGDLARIPKGFVPRNVIGGNAFFKKLGQFTESSDSMNLENFSPWGVSVGDLNADGYLDLFISAGMGFPFRYEINSVKLNDRGRRFVDAEFQLGVEPKPVTDFPIFTLDCKGRDATHARCIHCAFEFSKSDPDCADKDPAGHLIVRSSNSTRSSAVVDLDNDGALDVATTQYNYKPQILLSDLAKRKNIHWLKIKLRGRKSNRDALGATVQVTYPDGTRQVQLNNGQSGYLSQSSLPLYFGLGDFTAIEKLEVHWPSGKTQRINGKEVKTGQLREIVEN